MPRKPRIHFPGAVYHVMLRGNSGQDIFNDDSDRSRFLLILQQEQEKANCRVHAYCLMNNHVHLAIQVADVPLSKIMQKTGFRYTQYFNLKMKRTGHLFQGRYKAVLVDENSYLLELVRYIHLNPLRAKIVEKPEQYRWSSHLCYLRNIDTPWLTTDWVLSQFDTRQEKAKQQYSVFILDGFTDGFKKEFHSGSFEGRLLGDDQFIEHALACAEQDFSRPVTLDAVLASVCDYYIIDIVDLSAPGRRQPFAEARAVAAWLVRDSGTLRMTDLGKRLNRDLTGLSRAATRTEQRAKSDNDEKERLELIRKNAHKSDSQA